MKGVYLQKNSPFYWIRYYDKYERDKSKRRKSVNTKIQVTAADWRRFYDKGKIQGNIQVKNLLSELREGLAKRNIELKSGFRLSRKIILSDILREYLISNPGLKYNSKALYEYAANKFITALDDKQIHKYSKEDYSNFVDWMRANVPNETTQSTISKHLSVIFNYAVKQGYIRESIIKLLKAPAGLPEPIPEEDLKTILAYYRNKSFLLRSQKVNFSEDEIFHQKLIILIMYYTGMRQSSVLNLTWDNISLEGRYIIVKNIKGKKNFIFPLHDKLYELLITIPQKEERLINRGDKRLSFWDRDLGRLIKEGKIKKKYQMYQLRDTFATTCANARLDISIVQDLLSHSSINITKNNYLLYESERNRQLLNKINFL